MSDEQNLEREHRGSRPPSKKAVTARRLGVGTALVIVGALGAGAGALAQRNHQPVLVTLVPAPVSAMKEWSPVAVKGRVAEVFGNKFILADDSGRALIETGPKGDDGSLVSKDEIVTVQGRFEHGFVHAAALQHADNRTVLLGPPGPPPSRKPES